MQTLDPADAVRSLKGWRVDDGDRPAISRSLRFADFNTAFGFMARVALAAETAGHHPDWSNSWNVVEVSLTTHSAGSTVTAKDRDLAAAIDALL